VRTSGSPGAIAAVELHSRPYRSRLPKGRPHGVSPDDLEHDERLLPQRRRRTDPLRRKRLLDPDVERDTPVLIFAGLRDRVVPLANAEFLATRIPQSRLAVINSGHFVWEEAPDEFAALITAWVSGGYREPLSEAVD
jgi:pimeloyl-ACP methyl ester carboxylesterase